MLKRTAFFVILLSLSMIYSTAFAQGGGLAFEPPYVSANVADSAVFRLENLQLGESGGVSFDLTIGSDTADAKDCPLTVQDGIVDAGAAAEVTDCGKLSYRASWAKTSIPANAEVIRVSLVSRMSGFTSIVPMPTDPTTGPTGWGIDYHAPLMISFYG